MRVTRWEDDGDVHEHDEHDENLSPACSLSSPVDIFVGMLPEALLREIWRRHLHSPPRSRL